MPYSITIVNVQLYRRRYLNHFTFSNIFQFYAFPDIVDLLFRTAFAFDIIRGLAFLKGGRGADQFWKIIELPL